MPRRAFVTIRRIAMKTFLPLAALCIFLTAFTFAYPARSEIELKAPSGGRASGDALIERMEFMPGLRSLGLDLRGLEPGGVYSVWYSDESGRREPAGVGSNHFKAGPSGNGRYVTTVYQDRLDGWEYIEIFLHPDGDPANTAGMAPALRGSLGYSR